MSGNNAMRQGYYHGLANGPRRTDIGIRQQANYDRGYEQGYAEYLLDIPRREAEAEEEALRLDAAWVRRKRLEE